MPAAARRSIWWVPVREAEELLRLLQQRLILQFLRLLPSQEQRLMLPGAVRPVHLRLLEPEVGSALEVAAQRARPRFALFWRTQPPRNSLVFAAGLSLW